jgi:hypothetical protein
LQEKERENELFPPTLISVLKTKRNVIIVKNKNENNRNLKGKSWGNIKVDFYRRLMISF